MKTILATVTEKHQPLRDLVFVSLREAIINGSIKPGEKLIETELAARLGVSRTPVREAIRKLELEGLVAILPRKGVIAKGISLSEAEEIYAIRGVLEGLAARIATKKITEEYLKKLECLLEEMALDTEKRWVHSILKKNTQFHDIIIKASGNVRLGEMVGNLRKYIQKFRLITLSLPGRPKEVLKEHRKILEAFKQKDGKLVEELMREHIGRAGDLLVRSMSMKRKE